jgi:hypothetical protein
MMTDRKTKLLRAAFLVGAITDALAVIPMLSPTVAHLMMGWEGMNEPYRFAMGYAASLMTGWTALLIWAYRSPVERAFVAVLTIIVIAGLAITEIVGVLYGALPAPRMIPTWILQAVLLSLFAYAYFYPSLAKANGVSS